MPRPRLISRAAAAALAAALLVPVAPALAAGPVQLEKVAADALRHTSDAGVQTLVLLGDHASVLVDPGRSAKEAKRLGLALDRRHFAPVVAVVLTDTSEAALAAVDGLPRGVSVYVHEDAVDAVKKALPNRRLFAVDDGGSARIGGVAFSIAREDGGLVVRGDAGVALRTVSGGGEVVESKAKIPDPTATLR